MSGFRFYNPAPVFFDLLGLEPLAGGSLTFYAKGTTTPKGTWSDSDLTIANTNPVQLDSSGRANVNIWCDGGYTVIIKSADGTTVRTCDIDAGQGAGVTIPPLTTAGFMTHDFSNLIWQDFPMLPDPTGSDGKVPVANGGGYTLTSFPTIPSLPIVNSSSSDKIGTLLIQYGSATAPASGNRQTAVSVTFPVAYDQPAFIVIPIVRNDTHTSGQQIAVPAEPVKTATGFSLRFDTDDFGQSNANIIGAVNFDWIAFGRKA